MKRATTDFHPARGSILDAPVHERPLPMAAIVELLELTGDETVVDYRPRNGSLALAVADALPRGLVITAHEDDELIWCLGERLAHAVNAGPVRIDQGRVPLPDGTADRVVSLGGLRELAEESTLAEMRRLVSPDGFLLVIGCDRRPTADSR